MSFRAEGGCLCGAIRYRISAEPTAVMHCHCSNCRKASGAAVLTWLTVGAEHLEWLQDEPQRYAYDSEHYSGGVARLFCGTCGSQLGWSSDADSTADLTVGSLDDPNVVHPAYHVFIRSKVHWLELDDDLPRYETRGSDHQGSSASC